MVTLAIEKRDTTISRKELERQGKMPAVFYGRKEPATPIAVPHRAFAKVWHAAGESSVITLTGVGEDKDALIHEIDRDPVTGILRHADFYVVEKGRMVSVDVPLEFTGVSSAVKDLGGTLVKIVHELQVEALPKDLPHSITVDISSLDAFNKRITVKDIGLPDGVTALADPEEVVAIVEEPKEEEEEKPPEEIDMTAIEVEQKGKTEEEPTGEAEATEPK